MDIENRITDLLITAETAGDVTDDEIVGGLIEEARRGGANRSVSLEALQGAAKRAEALSESAQSDAQDDLTDEQRGRRYRAYIALSEAVGRVRGSGPGRRKP